MVNAKQLKNNISRWLRTHSDKVLQNRSSFPRRELTADSSSSLYDSYKISLQNITKSQKKEEINQLKQRLYNEAKKWGYQVSLSSSSIPKLKDYINYFNRALQLNFKRQDDKPVSFNQLSKFLSSKGENGIVFDDIHGDYQIKRPQLQVVRPVRPLKQYIITTTQYYAFSSEQKWDSEERKNNSIIRRNGIVYRPLSSSVIADDVESSYDIFRYSDTFIDRLSVHIGTLNGEEKVVAGALTDEYIRFMKRIYQNFNITDAGGNITDGDGNGVVSAGEIHINSLSFQINRVAGRYPDDVHLLHIQSVQEIDKNPQRSLIPLVQRKLKDDVSYDKIYSKYTSYNSIILDNPDTTPDNGQCVITNIVNTFGDSWNNYQKKNIKKPKYLTRDFVIQYFQSKGVGRPLESADTSRGLSIEEFTPFFVDNRLSFVIYDKWDKVIHKYTPDSPNKNVRGTMRCMVYDNHLFTYNNNLKSLIALSGDSNNGDVDEFLSKPSSTFHLGNSKTKHTYTYIGDFENIKTLKLIPDAHMTVYTHDDVNNVLTLLVEKYKYIPRINRAGRDLITSITIKIEDTTITIENCKTEVGTLLEFRDDEQYQCYHNFSNELRSCLLNTDNISQYSRKYLSIAKKYTPKALVGVCNPELNHFGMGDLYMLDVSKFYTSILMNLPFLPMKSGFDDFAPLSRPYVFHDKVEYLFIRNDSVKIPEVVAYTILNNPVILLNGYSYKRLLEICPEFPTYICDCIFASDSVSYANNKTRDIVQRLYENKLLTSLQKKLVVNFITGHLEKTSNNKQRIEMFTNLDDAIDFKTRLSQRNEKASNAYIHQIHKYFKKFDTNLNILSYKSETSLVNGFYPIKSFIYQLARIEKLRLSLMLKEKYNATILGYHTDAIYFRTVKPVDIIQKDNYTPFSSIGTYTIERRDTINLSRKPVYNSENTGVSQTLKVVESVRQECDFNHLVKVYTLRHEAQWSTNPQLYNQEAIELALKILETDRTLMIVADILGAGKTYLANIIVAYLKSIGKCVVSCSLTNKRVQELSQSNVDCQTYHNLLSIRLSDDGNDEMIETDGKTTKLRDVDYIYIDEIGMLSIKLLFKLSRVMEKYPNIKLIATGDIYQQTVDTHTKTFDNDAYKTRALNSIFPNVITLKENKRFKNPKDVEALNIIKDKLVNHDSTDSRRFISQYLQPTDNIVDIYNMIFNNPDPVVCICYFQQTRKYINDLMHDLHIKRTQPHLVKTVYDHKLVNGDVLVVCEKRTTKEHVFQVNTEYKIIGFNDTDVVLENIITGEVVDLPNIWFSQEKSFFTYNYCYTSIQTQGDTYKDTNLVIFDMFSSLFSGRGIYTSIGRATSLDRVYVYTGKDINYSFVRDELRDKFLQSRINSHKEADRLADRPFRDEDFVDSQWVLDKFQHGNPKCHCGKSLTLDISNKHHLFSIDRIHNSLPHTRDNCILSCYHCNTSRKNRELIM